MKSSSSSKSRPSADNAADAAPAPELGGEEAAVAGVLVPPLALGPVEEAAKQRRRPAASVLPSAGPVASSAVAAAKATGSVHCRLVGLGGEPHPRKLAPAASAMHDEHSFFIGMKSSSPSACWISAWHMW